MPVRPGVAMCGEKEVIATDSTARIYGRGARRKRQGQDPRHLGSRDARSIRRIVLPDLVRPLLDAGERRRRVARRPKSVTFPGRVGDPSVDRRRYRERATRCPP